MSDSNKEWGEWVFVNRTLKGIPEELRSDDIIQIAYVNSFGEFRVDGVEDTVKYSSTNVKDRYAGAPCAWGGVIAYRVKKPKEVTLDVALYSNYLGEYSVCLSGELSGYKCLDTQRVTFKIND